MTSNRSFASCRWLACALAASALVSTTFSACGGSTATAADDGGTTGNGDGSMTDGSSSSSDSGKSGDGSTTSSACPSSAPTNGSSCTQNGLACEYGDFIQLACDEIATCESGSWSVTIPSDCHVDLDAAACPATQSDVPSGDACTDLGLECDYASGVCYCTVDHTGAPQVWTCYPTTGCPYPRPRLGDTCTSEGLQCDYSTCGASVQCTDGTWHAGNGGCHP